MCCHGGNKPVSLRSHPASQHMYTHAYFLHTYEHHLCRDLVYLYSLGPPGVSSRLRSLGLCWFVCLGWAATSLTFPSRRCCWERIRVLKDLIPLYSFNVQKILLFLCSFLKSRDKFCMELQALVCRIHTHKNHSISRSLSLHIYEFI